MKTAFEPKQAALHPSSYCPTPCLSHYPLAQCLIILLAVQPQCTAHTPISVHVS